MKLYILSLLLLLSSFVSAQNLVSTQTLQTQTSSGINALLFLSGSSVRVDFDVEIIRVTYSTLGSDGAADIASGLFVVPLETDSPLPLHAHLHGTTTKENVPSTLGGGYELGLVYAGLGQFVVMPDYLGMGTSRGFHPYVHRATVASATVDMLFAAQEYVESRNDVEISDQLIIAGYSQGGHSAMAVQQSIETTYTDDFDLIASTPMSGPYDLSGAFKDFVFSENEYFFPGYLLYQIIGYKQVDPELYDSLDDILKEPYRAAAKEFEATGLNLGNLQDELINLLIQNEGASIPIKMFNDDYATDLITNDEHPFNLALRENDTYNFIATAPTRIIYCTGDDQVPFRNSITADSILNANGSVNVSSIDVLATADHGACVFPAVEESIRFINQFLQSTPTFELPKALEGISVFPNPASDFIIAKNNEAQLKLQSIYIYDMSASLISAVNLINAPSQKIDVSNLLPGTYAFEIRTSEGSVWEKIIKQ